MRIAVWILIFLLVVSCEKEEVIKRIPTFEERETLQVLTSVPGTLQYYCERDTSFIYLKPDDVTLNPLILEPEDAYPYMWRWFLNWYYKYPCEPLETFYIQHPNLKLLISGSIKQAEPSDTLLNGMASPFVSDTLIKIQECYIPYPPKKGNFPLQETSWRFIEMISENDTLRPTCEFNYMRIYFSSELEDISDLGEEKFAYPLGMDFGSSGGCIYHYTYDADSLNVISTVCLLGFSNTTKDMQNLASNILSAFQVGSFSQDLYPVKYKIENNYLTIQNSENQSLLFVAELE